MIADIIPEAYDAQGRQVAQPLLKKKAPHPTFSMGRYVSQPLTVHCATIDDVREFLRTCRAVSDKELFGKEEYWQPPEEFEKRKAGDCEDFSLWTWRQLLMLGLDARVVFGRHGRYGIGHAWAMFFENGKCFLVEPQARSLGRRLPRLSTLQYHPKFSVGWDGKTLRYYVHKDNSEFHAGWSVVVPLIPEWVRIWGWFWSRVAVRAPYAVPRRLLRRLRKKATASAA
jgi:Bacterial transglutaminase-like cysteine proteinase BTLCP